MGFDLDLTETGTLNQKLKILKFPTFKLVFGKLHD